MKMISLNNGIHLFTVNRSAANCMNVFIISNIFQWIASFGIRLNNDSRSVHFQPTQLVERNFILGVIHSHTSVANSSQTVEN